MSNVIDLDGMTPMEKIALADNLNNEVISNGIAGVPKKPEAAMKPHVRHVEVDGVSLDVDMRRMNDYRTLALIAKVEGGDSFAAISLFDFILGDERDRCLAELSDADGFCPAEKFAAFCAKVIEAVGAKN